MFPYSNLRSFTYSANCEIRLSSAVVSICTQTFDHLQRAGQILSRSCRDSRLNKENEMLSAFMSVFALRNEGQVRGLMIFSVKAFRR